MTLSKSQELETERYILSTMPVLYAPLWKFNSTSHSSDSNGHLCTVVGTPRSLRGRTFTGDAQYITLAESDSLNITGNLTIATWVWMNAGATTPPIVAKWGAKTAYMLSIFPANKFSFDIVVSTVDKTVASANTYNDSNWHLAMGYFNSVNVCLDIDGGKELVTGDATAGPIDNDAGNVVRIANFNSVTTGGFIGEMGDVMIWNRVFTARERQNFYKLTKWRYT